MNACRTEEEAAVKIFIMAAAAVILRLLSAKYRADYALHNILSKFSGFFVAHAN